MSSHYTEMPLSQQRIHPASSAHGKMSNQSLWAPPPDVAAGVQRPEPRSRVSIAGLNIVFSREASWPRRLLWLLVLLTLVVWLIIQLMVPFAKLAHGGTTWRFSKQREDSVRLPALTICHNNKYNKTAVDTMSVPGATLMDWLSHDTKPFSLLDWSRYNLDQFLQAAAFNWQDMFTECRIWKSRCMKVGSVRTLQSPMLGHCATLVTNASVQNSILSPQVKLALTEKGPFDRYDHDGWTLFIHQSDILFNDFVLFLGLAKPIKLYANSSITVTIDTNINVLLSGTGRCGGATAPEHQTCVEDCIAKHANLTSTVCRIPWIKSSLNQPPCTSYRDFEESSHLQPNSFDESKMATSLSHCPCVQPCSWMEYVISTPYRIGVEETRGVLGTRRGGGTHLITQAELWFSTTVQTTEETHVYPLSRFLAEVGGSLGLMIGASLLTLAEIVDHFVCTCYYVARRRWNIQ